jgi:hypothetical protein
MAGDDTIGGKNMEKINPQYEPLNLTNDYLRWLIRYLDTWLSLVFKKGFSGPQTGPRSQAL